jgi:hypothetical protein
MVFTIDTDPIFCEIAIRRLEHYHATGQLGWQNSHAFESDVLVHFEPGPDELATVEPSPSKPDTFQPAQGVLF